MKLISRTTRIDDATYEPIHTVTVEITQTFLDDLKVIESIIDKNEAALILGTGFMELVIDKGN